MTATTTRTRGPAAPRTRASLRRAGRAAAGLLTAVVTAGVLLAVPGTASAATTAEIKLAQTDLNGLAYGAGAVDGIVGPQTTDATGAFQADQCLDVDGVIGPQTLGGLQTVVKAVQEKAGITEDGDYTAATTAAVKTYQSAHGLDADGIAGPDTMKSMGIERVVASCHAGNAQRDEIVSVAKGELGTRADSRNCVPGKPYSICADWCASFATWVWRTAGENIPSMTYVPSVYDWAVQHGRWYGTSQLHAALPGDLIIFGSANNRYHIGVVDTVSGSTVHVISGNTSNPAGSGQIGVYDKSYSLSSSVFYGLVRA
ncbi:peptidoglycan-binding protein [Streptomyces sp. TS71-3]|uniref:peptidoglycan-binding protein n=1 Tax=Streptomyces sp. TS71-3 TaxID=2733862 RepID=UPI001B037BA3|nr:peptidoglycan-binding protein [Streptomyces sp. TS71-3]GHJ37463.1 hydrolase [Streptomyces sp. TS71-3]